MSQELSPLDPSLSQGERLAQAQERFTKYIETAETNPYGHMLRPKQIELMRKLHDVFLEDGEELAGYSSLPTGIGKTFLFGTFLKVTGLRGLVVAPTLSITDSNEEVMRYLGAAPGSVGTLSGSSSLCETQHITLTTYNSFRRQSQELHPHNFDVLILDEAHCALGAATRAVVESYKNCIKLGFTATDEYPDQSVKEILPREICRMTLKEAVEGKLLAPLRNIIAMTDVDMSNVRTVGQATDYRLDDMGKILDTRPYNKQIVEFYVANFLGQKALASCATVRHAYNLAETFRAHGIVAEPIEGRMNRKKQREIEERYKIRDPNSPDRIDVLTNAKLAEVGFDNTQISVGLNIAPTRSLVKGEQRARVTRLDADASKVGVIVDFLGRDLRWPPVLYAHSKIAGAAALGLEYDQLPDYKGVNGVKVISNPYEVDDIVAKFAEEDARVYCRPPGDWVVLSGIMKHIKNVSGSIISKIIDEITESDPDFVAENSAEFTVSGLATDSRKGVYFSPQLLRAVESRISFAEAPPAGWLSRAQIAARYDTDEPKMSNFLLRIIKENGEQGNVAKYAAGPETVKVQNYYSPQCVQAMAESRKLPYYGDDVPGSWCSQEQLSAKFGPNATAEALKSFSRLQKNILGINILDHQMTSNDTKFYSKKVAELVEKRVTPATGWLSWSDFVEQDGIKPADIDKLSKELRDWNINGRLCLVDGKEVRYYEARHRILIKKLAADL